MATAKKDPKHTDINPSHYKFMIRNCEGQTMEIEAADVVDALAINDGHLAHVLTYVLRAGRKTESSYVKDMGKAAWWCVRAVNAHGGHPDIPKTNLHGGME